MSDAYGGFKTGKLKLKGEKGGGHKKKKSSKKRDRGDGERSERKRLKTLEQEDTAKHGGWWAVSTLRQISGPVVIQLKGCFVKTLDDGGFTLGAPHDDGAGPDPEEVLLAVKVNDTKVAFKSGYNKYLKVDGRDGAVKGIADAVGAMEQWEPVFQDGKLALLGPNNRFLSLDDDKESLVCDKQRAGDTEMIKIRSNAEREEDKEEVVPDEEKGNVGQIELNYVKKFQKFQDHKIRLCQDDRRTLLKAKEEGDLHETLLDRRAKMKADRYCK